MQYLYLLFAGWRGFLEKLHTAVWGCSSVGLASDQHTTEADLIPWFSAKVNFQRRLSYGVCTPECATACINICAHAKDPVVHVRVQWIIETVKHQACTLGWVT